MKAFGKPSLFAAISRKTLDGLSKLVQSCCPRLSITSEVLGSAAIRSKSLISLGVGSRCFMVLTPPLGRASILSRGDAFHVNPKFPGSLLVDVVQAEVDNPAVPTSCYRLSGHIPISFRPDFH